MSDTLRRRLAIAYAAVLVGLAISIYVRDGIRPMLVILGAGAGLSVVVFAEFWLTGTQVVKHARTYRSELPGVASQVRALEAQRRKELHR